MLSGFQVLLSDSVLLLTCFSFLTLETTVVLPHGEFAQLFHFFSVKAEAPIFFLTLETVHFTFIIYYISPNAFESPQRMGIGSAGVGGMVKADF